MLRGLQQKGPINSWILFLQRKVCRNKSQFYPQDYMYLYLYFFYCVKSTEGNEDDDSKEEKKSADSEPEDFETWKKRLLSTAGEDT